MNTNILSIIYLAFRLAPFILITYFVVNYVMYQEMASLIHLGGLLIACLVAICVGTFTILEQPKDIRKNSMCNTLALTPNGPLSNLPLSIVIYTFTLTYIGIIISFYERNQSNLPYLVFLPVITFLDFCWLYFFGCAKMLNIFAAGVVGVGIGGLWAYIIYKSSLRQTQYYSILSDTPECKIGANKTFSCVKRSQIGADSTVVATPSADLSLSLGPVASNASILQGKMKSLFTNAQSLV